MNVHGDFLPKPGHSVFSFPSSSAEAFHSSPFPLATSCREGQEQRTHLALAAPPDPGSTVPHSQRVVVTTHIRALVPPTQGFLPPLWGGGRKERQVICEHFSQEQGDEPTPTAALLRAPIPANTTSQNTEPGVLCPLLACPPTFHPAQVTWGEERSCGVISCMFSLRLRRE